MDSVKNHWMQHRTTKLDATALFDARKNVILINIQD